MGEIPFQNPANDEADERPGETPGERAQRLYEQAAGARQPGADAGPGSGAHEFDLTWRRQVLAAVQHRGEQVADLG